MQLTSAGLLFLLASAAMTLFVDFDTVPTKASAQDFVHDRGTR